MFQRFFFLFGDLNFLLFWLIVKLSLSILFVKRFTQFICFYLSTTRDTVPKEFVKIKVLRRQKSQTFALAHKFLPSSARVNEEIVTAIFKFFRIFLGYSKCSDPKLYDYESLGVICSFLVVFGGCVKLRQVIFRPKPSEFGVNRKETGVFDGLFELGKLILEIW